MNNELDESQYQRDMVRLAMLYCFDCFFRLESSVCVCCFAQFRQLNWILFELMENDALAI